MATLFFFGIEELGYAEHRIDYPRAKWSTGVGYLLPYALSVLVRLR
jgi:hypothetical protein